MAGDDSTYHAFQPAGMLAPCSGCDRGFPLAAATPNCRRPHLPLMHTTTPHPPTTAGAELANVVNEASLLAARVGQDNITLLELAEGVRRTRFGVNGGSPGRGGAGDALAKRLGSWLMELSSPSNGKAKALSV